MSASRILSALADSESISELLDQADVPLLKVAALDGLRPELIAMIHARRVAAGHRQTLVIAATGRETEAMLASLRTLTDGVELLELEAWETLPHERLSPSPQVVGARLQTLGRMAALRDGAEQGSQIIVASVRAALQPIADNLTSGMQTHLSVGDQISLDEVVTSLIELAYARVDLVTRRGEFAVRGGIIDVFPPLADYPYRIEFFGDEVDEIRNFQVADQRSDPKVIKDVTIAASREILLTDNVRARAREMLHEFPNLTEMLEKLAEGIPTDGMESLIGVLADKLVPVTEYMSSNSELIVLAPERVRTRAEHLVETNREFLNAAWSAATAGADAPIDLSGGEYMSLGDLQQARGQRSWIEITPFDDNSDDTVAIAADAPPSFAGDAESSLAYLRKHSEDKWRIVVATVAQGTTDRAVELIAAGHIPVVRDAKQLKAGEVLVAKGELDEGFRLPDAKLLVLTEAEFFGRQANYRTVGGTTRKLATRRKRNAIDPMQLHAGDFVVHDQHGIGRFVEMVKRSVGRPMPGGESAQKTREYLLIEYAPSKKGKPADKLYVPTDQMDQLTKYVGGETPTLSKIGGSDWAKTKGRARKAVREIAIHLVKLYSERMRQPGFQFPPDAPWQRELEDAFPFAETPDQLQTIDEVKADMEKPVPMDRLIAGDVGFGKTEIAIRAAFKAVQAGKQVAMLVPTTLLVQQHFETFSDRFAGFPVNLRPMSRFQTAKEIKSTTAGLADGTVDIVIGTHRILSDNVHFKELGLVIIDEEQRFGVDHKEKLKGLKTNVDVLSMSATPIPRTLEMAVTGIREMSTLATPPEQRHPVLTYVGAYSDKQVAAAIRRELLREGQVFFVHNRVQSINRVAAKLAELVPEARIGVAHGQMPESQLENVIVDFWQRKFDVLVSTTIIETGMDIQNANTLIVDRADRYGLSQLHQLRGRVGRGRERAYAYFLWDGDRPLSETAHQRLETIAANNELGSGMQVAMKDLELRGAGNMLGEEQSGHIAGVGFDLYLRMVGEAVSTFRTGKEQVARELRFELPVSALIPADYISSDRLRLEAYQKLASAAGPTSKPGTVDDVVSELTDRYGEMPLQTRNLVALTRVRRLLQRADLSEVVAVGPRLKLAPVALSDSMQVRLQRMYPQAKYIGDQHQLMLPMPEDLIADQDATGLLDWLYKLVTVLDIAQDDAEESNK